MNKNNFLNQVKDDLKQNGWDNNSVFTAIRMLLLRLGVQLLIFYRIQHRLVKIPIVGKTLARIVKYVAQIITGCDISSSANIEGGVAIPHPIGIVIGEGSTIKFGCTIYQQVTLGTDKKGGYPSIENNVIIYAGAKVIGAIVVKKNAIVGANAVVLKDVEENTVVAGVPASVINTLDAN